MIEEIQKSFLKKISGTTKNYWDCLKAMNIYSLQRRRERYRIIYIWKVLEDMVPNVNDGIKSKENPRLGRMCILSISNSKTSKIRESTLVA